jgi:hypothetical protein
VLRHCAVLLVGEGRPHYAGAAAFRPAEREVRAHVPDVADLEAVASPRKANHRGS